MNALRVGGWPSGRPSCVQPRKAFIMIKKMAYLPYDSWIPERYVDTFRLGIGPIALIKHCLR